jgi:hypothetical protein
MGYIIHKEKPDDFGLLRKKDDITKGLEWKGQKNYDIVGELVYKYIQEQMVNEYGLKEVWVPEDSVIGEERP